MFRAALLLALLGATSAAAQSPLDVFIAKATDLEVAIASTDDFKVLELKYRDVVSLCGKLSVAAGLNAGGTPHPIRAAIWAECSTYVKLASGQETGTGLSAYGGGKVTIATVRGVDLPKMDKQLSKLKSLTWP